MALVMQTRLVIFEILSFPGQSSLPPLYVLTTRWSYMNAKVGQPGSLIGYFAHRLLLVGCCFLLTALKVKVKWLIMKVA